MTLLLVDDECYLRRRMASRLRRHGHAVITAAHGQEGWMILRTESSIRLVITEVQLPLLDGRTMVAMARGRRPELCVLFTTRHPETLALSHDGVLAQAGMDMLLKPFDLDLLVSRVHTLLQHFVHRS